MIEIEWVLRPGRLLWYGYVAHRGVGYGYESLWLTYRDRYALTRRGLERKLARDERAVLRLHGPRDEIRIERPSHPEPIRDTGQRTGY